MAKTKLISDSAMNSPTVMSEDEKEENDDNGIRRAKTPECLEYDEKYWLRFLRHKQCAPSRAGAWRREGTREGRESVAEFKRTHRVKNLFKTHIVEYCF